jgi:RimJ/RimL family protein N-acetyltransferase
LGVPKVTIRPARPDEAALAADIMTAAFPREPQDAVLTARRWEHPREGWTHGRFIAELEGKPAGFLEWGHGPWSQLPERNCWVEVWMDLAHMDEKVLTDWWRWIEKAAAADGARSLNAACGEDEPEMIRALQALGYKHQRTERVWTLDLRKRGADLAAAAQAARDRMREADIDLKVLAAWKDPERYRKLHELNELMRRDVPHTAPVLPQTLADFMVRVESPSTPPDRWWIAFDGDEPVAMSFLSYPPQRGPVWTSFTGTHPNYRGRGIARAVKLQTLAQAVELGVSEVRTDNDSENAPMLHINEALGYELMPGYLSFLKRLPSGPLR